MMSLLFVFFSILLFSALLYSGMSYITPDLGVARETQTLATVGFAQLDAGFRAYRYANGAPPSAADWRGELIPDFSQPPLTIRNLTWSYGAGAAGGRYFCLSGAMSEAQRQGLVRVQDRFAPGLLILSDACGETADENVPAIFPATQAATYWVSAP